MRYRRDNIKGKSYFFTVKLKDRKSQIANGERGIWQCRYWEHCIRDERDFENHLEYIHFNPVKHGYVKACG